MKQQTHQSVLFHWRASTKIPPHGNAKKRQRPFIPTTPSTVSSKEEKEKKSAMGPAKIFDQTFEEKGGMKMKAAYDVPRNA